MQQHAWLPAHEDVITLHRSCGSYIGYQCDSGWDLSLLSWSWRLSATWHHSICQMIASSLPSPVVIIVFSHQLVSSAPLRAPVHISVIGHFLLPDQEFGTVCLHKSITGICHLTVFIGSWRPILLFKAPAPSDWFF